MVILEKGTNMQPLIIVPGFGGSGPEHWQTFWEIELPHARRIRVANWDAPERADWLRALDDAIRTAEAPPILIAHSLGCVAVAHWAASASRLIRGALLVAPADLDRASCPDVLHELRPIPRQRLPFPSHVIASDDDPYATLDRSRQMADAWGAQLTVLYRAGHINVESGFGPWREGQRWVDALARSPAASASQRTRDFAGA
jgi:predicted alpha/beta hydrolase family esterase